MKTRKNIYFKVVALAVIAIAFAMPAKAQLSDNGYAKYRLAVQCSVKQSFCRQSKWLGYELRRWLLRDSQHRFGTFPQLSQQPRICRSRNLPNGRLVM